MKDIGGSSKAKSGKGKSKLLLVCILPIPHTCVCGQDTELNHKAQKASVIL